MKKIGITAKVQNRLGPEVIRELIGWGKDKDVEFIMDRETAELVGESSNLARADLPARSDVIIVFGGDGTILSIARMIDGKDVPILGVNLGSLGFLTEVAREEMLETLDLMLENKTGQEERMMLDVETVSDGKHVSRHSALNDVVIRGQRARIIDIELTVNEQPVTTYRADGLIISTPTGSTAYSLSAGGPILYPTMDAIIISPISPHTLTHRPIVIPSDSSVKVRAVNQEEDVQATLDGQVGFSLTYRDVLHIKKSKNVTKLILLPRKNYFEVLRDKLRWGESP